MGKASAILRPVQGTSNQINLCIPQTRADGGKGASPGLLFAAPLPAERAGLTMPVEVIVSGGARSVNRIPFNQKRHLEAVTK